jgi:hypothetical protein
VLQVIYKDYTEIDINNVYAAKEALPENLRYIAENNKETLAQFLRIFVIRKKTTKLFLIYFSKLFRNRGFGNFY